MKIKTVFIPLIALALFSCESEVTVKPAGKLKLSYPKPVYQQIKENCPYTFEINDQAQTLKKKNCDINVVYPKMKATVYLTYQQIRNNNLDSLLRDAQKLAYNHSIKANSIPEQPFMNPDSKVYGMFYMINGDAATQAGFYMTDSINHFLNGALYFEAKPNFDSIYPAVMYLREDIRHLIETLEWQDILPEEH